MLQTVKVKTPCRSWRGDIHNPTLLRVLFVWRWALVLDELQQVAHDTHRSDSRARTGALDY